MKFSNGAERGLDLVVTKLAAISVQVSGRLGRCWDALTLFLCRVGDMRTTLPDSRSDDDKLARLVLL